LQRFRLAVLAAATPFVMHAGMASGQDMDSPPVEAVEAAFPVPPPSQAASATVPALTPLTLEILADLGSKTSKSGDQFPIRLHEPVVVDGVTVIPVGTPGMGEVVHAKKGGSSGAAGELVLAARYLDYEGARIRLRSMRMDGNGASKIRSVNDMAIAAALTVPAVALFGFAVKGGDSDIPSGSLASAKTAEAFAVPSRDEIPPFSPAAVSPLAEIPVQPEERP